VTDYVCGFMFSESPQGPRVLLIQKNRPAWQAGRLNGIGGKIEDGESPLDAMVREFREEAGLSLIPTCWSPVAVLTGDSFCVHFFSCWVYPGVFEDATAQTDETLVPVYVRDLHLFPIIPNLHVLIPLALDRSGIVKPVMLRDDMPVQA
jgi:8-oxo-dGTP diphosphatase